MVRQSSDWSWLVALLTRRLSWSSLRRCSSPSDPATTSLEWCAPRFWQGIEAVHHATSSPAPYRPRIRVGCPCVISAQVNREMSRRDDPSLSLGQGRLIDVRRDPALSPKAEQSHCEESVISAAFVITYRGGLAQGCRRWLRSWHRRSSERTSIPSGPGRISFEHIAACPRG